MTQELGYDFSCDDAKPTVAAAFSKVFQ